MLRGLCLGCHQLFHLSCQETVTARKDDASAAHQAAHTKVAGWGSCSEGGGLIHTTSGYRQQRVERLQRRG
jgi:hypothetical protein